MNQPYMTGYCRPVYIGWAYLNLGIEIVDPSWYRTRKVHAVILMQLFNHLFEAHGKGQTDRTICYLKFFMLNDPLK